jgi:hypothetical protein
VYTEQAATKDHHRYWHRVVEANANGGTVTVTAGQVPKSNAVTLPGGVYEWRPRIRATRFGTETEIVVPPFQCGNGQRTSKSSCWNDATELGRSARRPARVLASSQVVKTTRTQL